MAKVCFTWELGQGYGHLVRYRALINALVDAGHAVSFIVKDESRAKRVFSDLPIGIFAIEPGYTPPGERLVRLNSYAEILHDFGFHSPERLRRQVDAWLRYFSRLRPDVVIADHSPSALVATRIARIPTVFSGNGFTVPPRTTPMRPLRYWNVGEREQLPEHEALVLRSCNAVFEDHGCTPCRALADVLETELEWLLSFAELDHYGGREHGHYLGTYPDRTFGAVPNWKSCVGPKIFAYLSVRTLNDSLVRALRAVAGNLCIHAPQMGAGEFEKLPRDRLVVEPDPVNIDAVAGSADLVITNGSLNTVAAFLRAGIPQLVLPNNLERHMVSRQLELTGAGLLALWREPDRLTEKLRALLDERAFARNAENFARRYETARAAQQLNRMLEDLSPYLVP